MLGGLSAALYWFISNFIFIKILKYSFTFAKMVQRRYTHDSLRTDLKILMKNLPEIENAIYKQI